MDGQALNGIPTSSNSSNLNVSIPTNSPDQSNFDQEFNPEPNTFFPTTNGAPEDDVDPQIIEALKSKDRLYVLKLGEQFEMLLNGPDRRSRVELSPGTSYQRLLVHRCSAFYKLLPESDPVTKVISITATAESRIPSRRLADLVPAEEIAHPAFKIMRRGTGDRRPQSRSHTGSVAGEDADLSDIDPSEAGSLGGYSNTTGGSGKKHLTIEEREAAYNAARSRIFMGFQDKEKDKDANSSTMSVSGSTSAGGGSSIGDYDDDTSFHSPTTESEWSGPATRERKDVRRSSTNTSSSSSWSWRSPGSSSSRNSRAPSPSVSYPSLYDPSNPNSPYDPSHMPPHQPVGGPYGQMFYPYPNYPPNSAYLAPYYGYPSFPPPNPPQNGQEIGPPPPLPPSSEMYPPPPHFPYQNPYMWPPQPMPPHQHPPPSQHPNHNIPAPPSAQSPGGQGPYPQYPPPNPGFGYPMPYPYPPQNMNMMPPPIQPQGQFEYNMPIGPPGHPTLPLHRNGSGHSSSSVSRSSSSSRSSGMGKRRLWNGNHSDSVGPRMSTMRRVPSDMAHNKSSPNDDVSSVASSSTTSSSSRRTYTSTTSSQQQQQQQHPLPARPDWAVGLKPQPTLHTSRRDSPGSRSSNRNGSQTSPRPHEEQLTDFPPLSTVSSGSEKRIAVAGVWNNSRSILQPSPHSNGSPNGVSSPPSSDMPAANAGFNEQDPDFEPGFERPSPKTSPGLFNPKSAKRQSSGKPGEKNGKGDLSLITSQLDGVAIEDKGGFASTNVVDS